MPRSLEQRRDGMRLIREQMSDVQRFGTPAECLIARALDAIAVELQDHILEKIEFRDGVAELREQIKNRETTTP